MKKVNKIRRVTINGVVYQRHLVFDVGWPWEVIGVSDKINKDIVLMDKIFNIHVDCIQKDAFANSKIKSIILSKRICSIDDGTFKNCHNLETIYTQYPYLQLPPNTVADINNPPQIVDISKTQPENKSKEVIFNGIVYRLDLITKTHWEVVGFDNKADLKMVKIKKYIDGIIVSRISTNAFSNSSVKKIKIPKTITHIDDYAFANCNKLKNIYIQNKQIEINSTAFEGIDNLPKMIYRSLI